MPVRSLATAILMSALSSSATAQETTAVKPPVYEAYAVRYATLTGFPVASLVQGAEKDRKLDIAMTVWVLKGPRGGRSGRFRVLPAEAPGGMEGDRDFTGPTRPSNDWGSSRRTSPTSSSPTCHWDHADGADLFPKAKIWIQKDEYEHYFAEAKPGTDGELDHLSALVKLHAEGRVHLVDGDAKEILPGVTVYTGGKHTFASQYVGVNTKAGRMVIASDNVYLYENLDKHVPIAATLDAKSNLAAQDRMKQIASKPELIIPGHDPEVFVRFPKVAEGVVRLD